MDCVTVCQIKSDVQSRFRSACSTALVLFKITEDAIVARDQRQFCIESIVC